MESDGKSENRTIGFFILGIILIDQVSKYFARRYLSVVENPGLPFFGIDLPGALDIIFILLAFGFFLFYSQATAGFSLIIGGAVSNIIDRLAKGTVTDFIDLGIGNTFNVADVAIMVGILYLLICSKKSIPRQ